MREYYKMSEIINSSIRPWGYYTALLDSDDCKIKEIIVHPLHRMSYQFNSHQEKIWTIVNRYHHSNFKWKCNGLF